MPMNMFTLANGCGVLTDAYWAGYNAALKADFRPSEAENPHTAETYEWKAWNVGWNAAVPVSKSDGMTPELETTRAICH